MHDDASQWDVKKDNADIIKDLTNLEDEEKLTSDGDYQISDVEDKMKWQEKEIMQRMKKKMVIMMIVKVMETIQKLEKIVTKVKKRT